MCRCAPCAPTNYNMLFMNPIIVQLRVRFVRTHELQLMYGFTENILLT